MSWYFLRTGQPSAQAIEAIDRLILDLTSVRGSLNSRASLAANQYLLWTEGAELHLSSLMADRSIPRALFTERYWRIRAMDDNSVRPHPLIGAEVADQLRSLTEIRDQLAHYEGLLAAKDGERLLVCDTNVLVHGQLFDSVRWNEIVQEQKVCVVLPLVVVDELDSLKDKANRSAGRVLKELDARLVQGDTLQRVALRTNVTLQLVDEPSGHERLRGQDDEIVRQARYFSSMSGGKVTIVTRDRGMRVRAEAAGITAIPMPIGLERSEVQEAVDG